MNYKFLMVVIFVCFTILAPKLYAQDEVDEECLINERVEVKSGILTLPKEQEGPFKNLLIQPNREVKSFLINEHEVTVSSFNRFFGEHKTWQKDQLSKIERAIMEKYLNNNNQSPPCAAVTKVNWYWAKKYCTAQGGDLPTEIQWQYAAQLGGENPAYKVMELIPPKRAKKKHWDYFSQDDPDEDFTNEDKKIRAYDSVSKYCTDDYACFTPDKIGLIGMIGSVWEWTDSDYQSGNLVADNNLSGTWKVIKGGNQNAQAPVPQFLNSRARNYLQAKQHASHVGFRCAWPN